MVLSCLVHLALLVLFTGGNQGVRAEKRAVRIELALADASLPAGGDVVSPGRLSVVARPKQASIRPLTTGAVRPVVLEEAIPSDPGDPGPAPEIGAGKPADPPAAAVPPIGQAAAPAGENAPPDQA